MQILLTYADAGLPTPAGAALPGAPKLLPIQALRSAPLLRSRHAAPVASLPSPNGALSQSPAPHPPALLPGSSLGPALRPAPSLQQLHAVARGALLVAAAKKKGGKGGGGGWGAMHWLLLFLHALLPPVHALLLLSVHDLHSPVRAPLLLPLHALLPPVRALLLLTLHTLPLAQLRPFRQTDPGGRSPLACKWTCCTSVCSSSCLLSVRMTPVSCAGGGGGGGGQK